MLADVQVGESPIGGSAQLPPSLYPTTRRVTDSPEAREQKSPLAGRNASCYNVYRVRRHHTDHMVFRLNVVVSGVRRCLQQHQSVIFGNMIKNRLDFDGSRRTTRLRFPAASCARPPPEQESRTRIPSVMRFRVAVIRCSQVTVHGRANGRRAPLPITR